MNDIYILKGPNTWSRKQTELIVQELEIPRQNLNGLTEAIAEIRTSLPRLSFNNEKEVGYPELVMETAVELQNAAEMHCRFGEVKKLNDSKASIAVGYEIEKTGLYACEAAKRIVDTLIEGKKVEIEKDIEELKYLKGRYALGATSAFILHEAVSRGIPFKRFNRSSLVLLGYGNKHKKIRTAVTDTTSGLGIELAGDKEETKQILAEFHLPVPKGLLVDSEKGLKSSLTKLRFPLVTKPLDGNQGRGVSTGIRTMEQALFGLEIAQRISNTVILEEFIEGDDHRFLVINYKLVAVAKRTPAMIIGDGKSTISQLIDEVNKDPERGRGTDQVLALIKVDENTTKILSEKNLDLSSILPEKEILYLKKIANISAGGTASDVTDLVHPENIFLAERVARLFNLNICGIDILTTDISIPLSESGGAIVEVNAGPGIRMHTNPQHGIARNVAAPIIDMLFPDGDFLIPVIAVSDSENSSAIVQMISGIAAHSSLKAGFASTEGISIQDHFLTKENSANVKGSSAVLFEPTIDVAILECSSSSIINEGLAFSKCDISIVSSLDGVEYNGFKDSDAKTTLIRATSPEGFVILNADDESVEALSNKVSSNIAYYSSKVENSKLEENNRNGGYGACIEKGYIVLNKGEWKTRVEKISKLPEGIANRLETILPALLAAFIRGIDIKDIKEFLQGK
ncbi:MAG: Mur ligase family protein [Bacteroidota bacterium]|nr:Mur ligase family protein [Bacteroidota bacterium]